LTTAAAGVNNPHQPVAGQFPVNAFTRLGPAPGKTFLPKVISKH
jgi:hypothetical protein